MSTPVDVDDLRVVSAAATDPVRSPQYVLSPQYCALPVRPAPVLDPGLSTARSRAILLGRSKWVNGTVLHYCFTDGPDAQRAAVRAAFAEWKALGIGLVFTEVAQVSEAEVRIGFDGADGSWSYVGRDVLTIGSAEKTMNFGWDLTTPYGRTTALHEIGHTLGMPHEHQNPIAGIVWDEEAVYASLGAPPNNWDRATTFHNVLRKLDRREVEGSSFDAASIMEYTFEAGLILEPAQYRAGIPTPQGISPVDTAEVLTWYPTAGVPGPRSLEPFVSAAIDLAPGQQVDFLLTPAESRDHDVATFGATDSVLVLFEEVDDGTGPELRFRAGDDDSGEDRNAHLTLRLEAGHRYVARLRLYHAQAAGRSALMYW